MKTLLVMTFEGDEKCILDRVLAILEKEKVGSRGVNTVIKDERLRHTVEADNLKINYERKEIIRHGKKVDLTYKEFEILYYLASHPGYVFTHKQIYEAVWGKDFKEISLLCEKNMLPHISVHSLRHMFATILLERGVSIAKISGMLGHSSVHTTFEFYLEVMDADVKLMEFMNREFTLEEVDADAAKG